MSDPFTKQQKPGQPDWVNINTPNTTFTPLSSTGQEQLTGGYGLGTYGGGLYGEGDGVTISYNTTTATQWTPFTLK